MSTPTTPDERQAAWQELARSEARYRALVEATALDTFRTDASGRVVEDMPNWRAVTGQRLRDILSDGWLAVVHPDDRDRVRAVWEQAVRTTSRYECEYRIRALDGGYRSVLARGIPVVEGGEVVEWIGVCEDITARRAAQDDLRAQSRVVETLHEVGSKLQSRLDVEDLVQFITDATTELCGAAFGAFFSVESVEREDGSQTFDLLTLSGVPRERFEHLGKPRETPLFAPTLTGQATVLLDDVAADPRHGQNPPYQGMPEGHLPVRSYLAVPVRSKSGQVHGGLFFGHPVPGMFTSRHARLVEGIAAQAATALDNARLYEAERRSRQTAERAQRDLAFLAQATYALSASLDLQRTAEMVVRLAVPDVCDWSMLHLLHDGHALELADLHHRDEMMRASLLDVFQRHPVFADQPDGPAAALRTGQTQIILDVTGELRVANAVDDEHAQRLRELEVAAVVSVPLHTRDRVVGALTFVRERGEVFTPREVALLEELTSRSALALDSAMLFTRERTAALTLQRSLLPGAIPPIEHTACAVRYLPGAAGMEVGGDWYDVIPLGEGAVAYVVGDVMGRGVQAAGVMGQLRSAVRAYALEDHDPGEVLQRVDRMLQTAEEPPIVTCVYARLETRTGQLRIASAGHLPPLCIAADGKASFLELDPGVPLGVMETAFETTTVQLERDATILLYTDGLVESPDQPITAGMEALGDAALAYAGGDDLEALVDHLVSAVERGDGHSDDIAVLALRMPSRHRQEDTPAPSSQSAALTLAPEPTSVSKARVFLRETLEDWDVPVDVFEAQLLVSEIVTNALIHAGTVVHLGLEAREGALRVAVADEGPPEREVPTDGTLPRRMALGGRGLAIVDSVAQRWGVEPLPEGKRVWFELGFLAAS